MLKGQKSENMTETHQNKAQKAKLLGHKAPDRISAGVKDQKRKHRG